MRARVRVYGATYADSDASSPACRTLAGPAHEPYYLGNDEDEDTSNLGTVILDDDDSLKRSSTICVCNGEASCQAEDELPAGRRLLSMRRPLPPMRPHVASWSMCSGRSLPRPPRPLRTPSEQMQHELVLAESLLRAGMTDAAQH